MDLAIIFIIYATLNPDDDDDDDDDDDLIWQWLYTAISDIKIWHAWSLKLCVCSLKVLLYAWSTTERKVKYNLHNLRIYEIYVILLNTERKQESEQSVNGRWHDDDFDIFFACRSFVCPSVTLVDRWIVITQVGNLDNQLHKQLGLWF